MNQLVAFNIISGDKLLNPTNVPVLYYWNNEDGNLSDDLINDENFKNFIEDTCLNVNEYAKSKISYFKYDMSTEAYAQDVMIVQKVYSLSKINGKHLALSYLIEIFKYLYKYAIKEDYDVKNDTPAIDILLDIYNILKERNQKKILPETVRNYVRSELQQKYKLNEDNIEYILSSYDEIIN